ARPQRRTGSGNFFGSFRSYQTKQSFVKLRRSTVCCSLVLRVRGTSLRTYSVCSEQQLHMLEAVLNAYNNVTTTTKATHIDCLAKCQRVSCSAAVSVESNATCEMVTITTAKLSISANQVQQVIGSQVGAKVWKADDSDWPSPAVQLRNSSTGRNGSIQSVLINTTGCYLIKAAGARGGHNLLRSTSGGQGAQVSARVNLTAGTQLSIVVGQMGGSTSLDLEGGGGGGGSFVYRTVDQLLLLAAGGGGGASFSRNGQQGETGINGSDSLGAGTTLAGFGGTNGNPGSNSPSGTPSHSNHGGCGAGWLGRAVSPRRSSSDGERGGSLADGWVGGSAGDGSVCDGGFGGGGGCGSRTSPLNGTAGGGGGFSGGGAGLGFGHSGGGGGSFCSGGCVFGGTWTGDQGFVSVLLESDSATCNLDT
uniref:Apple domain-containing protein n=1 Tax=Macrostomum lignano TaxID=282301 RepID=A0A1I8HRN4_9PLAT